MKKVQVLLDDLMWDKRIKSINALSNLTGISRMTLHKLQNNESTMISFSTIETLCRVLDCKLEDLMQVK